VIANTLKIYGYKRIFHIKKITIDIIYELGFELHTQEKCIYFTKNNTDSISFNRFQELFPLRYITQKELIQLVENRGNYINTDNLPTNVVTYGRSLSTKEYCSYYAQFGIYKSESKLDIPEIMIVPQEQNKNEDTLRKIEVRLPIILQSQLFKNKKISLNMGTRYEISNK